MKVLLKAAIIPKVAGKKRGYKSKCLKIFETGQDDERDRGDF